MNNLLENLNPQQKEAVLCTEGPLLIISGAGSGKTTVLCRRIANIISRGLAQPWQILAVTFTNKAAAELRTRLSVMLSEGNGDSDTSWGGKHGEAVMPPTAANVWAGTFHSTCVKILRRGIELVGYKSGFTIYDTDDSLRVIKACMKDLNVSEKAFAPRMVFSAISRAKDKLITPERFKTDIDGKRDYFAETVKEVYSLYQKRLKSANALDFDDIIMKTVELLLINPDVLDKWQRQFRYIMVDEYQDTNYAQYKLISLLAGGNSSQKAGNICVVGDEDQSIYRFRGATIENILSFEDEFHARVIKLEQNYRSTQNILNAANGVIRKNTQRKDKTLFSAINGGDKVTLHILGDEQEEAMLVAREIEQSKGGKGGDPPVPFGENAVLYRTNAQSRTVELALARMSIPYRIIGGVRFYDRKEIKDIIAYMSVINNPFDLIRFGRIINEPKRSIGDATQAEIERISIETGLSPIDVMERASDFFSLQKKAKVLEKIAAIFNELSASAGERSLSDLIDDIIEQTGYLKMLQNEGEEGVPRIENIKELKSAALKFGEEHSAAVNEDYID
ncbi:MAG: UvrD-helicase domain-containing protein, partial [Oscillospiraceae bacterium]|nr:UvrD-helicase domain-containing protein [Oscillospiraceae bacterium]